MAKPISGRPPAGLPAAPPAASGPTSEAAEARPTEPARAAELARAIPERPRDVVVPALDPALDLGGPLGARAAAASPAERAALGTAVDKVKSSEAALREGIVRLEAELTTLERENAARTKQLDALTATLRGQAPALDDVVVGKTLVGTVLTVLGGGLLPLGIAWLSSRSDAKKSAQIEARVRTVRAEKAVLDQRIAQHRKVRDTLGAKLEQLRTREAALAEAARAPDAAPTSGLVGVRLAASALDRRRAVLDNLEGQVRLLEEMRDSAKSVGDALASLVERLEADIRAAREALQAARRELLQLAAVVAGARFSEFASAVVKRLLHDEVTPTLRAATTELLTDLIRTKAHEATTTWASQAARPIAAPGPIPPPGAPRDPAFAALDAVVGDARVVALGEPAHGLREAPELRNRVFAHLIEHAGFRAVTLESGVVEARLVDRWARDVEGKSGLALDDVLARGFTHGMGPWAETRELVTWVRAFNERAAAKGEPLVHFVGKDLPREGDTITVPLAEVLRFFEASGRPLTEAEAQLRALAERSAKVTTQVLDGLEAHGYPRVIDPDLLDAITSISFEQLSPGEREQLGAGLEALRHDLAVNAEAHVARYQAKTGATRAEAEDEHRFAVHMARVAEQLLQDLERRVIHPADPFTDAAEALLQRVYAARGEPTPAIDPAKRARTDDPRAVREFFEGRASRERNLAENVLHHAAEHGRVLSFAHNGHVNRAPGGTRIGGELVRDYAEGEFLSRALGPDYVVIGATTSRYLDAEGQPRAGVPAVHAGTLESLFAATEGPTILDLRRAPEGLVQDWLGAEQRIRHQDTLEPIVPSAAFDAVVHLPSARPAVKLG